MGRSSLEDKSFLFMENSKILKKATMEWVKALTTTIIIVENYCFIYILFPSIHKTMTRYTYVKGPFFLNSHLIHKHV